MADEAVIIELLGKNGDPMRFKVADGVKIEKGAILKLTDSRTAIINSANGDIIAGIAAEEKVASDGKLDISVYTNGVFDLKVEAGQTATIGSFVRVAGTANQVRLATTLDHETGKTIGKALETGSASEVIAVRVLL